MKALRILLIMLLTAPAGLTARAQENAQPADTADAANKRDITFMIGSLQTMFNLLGDPGVSRSDKDEIINHSYLKYFKDGKVQIEDDLDPNRQLPMNKDVQAYLQDIVFFFKKVKFTFEITAITKGLGEDNQVYFKATVNRIMEGVNLYGEPQKLAGERYIEFNYVPGEESYKIVSIYTTKLSEKEDIFAWWNTMSTPWKLFFADSIAINDTLSFDSILHMQVRILRPDTIIENPAELMAGDTFLLLGADTLCLCGKQFERSVLRVFKWRSLEIAPEDSINDLKPVEKMAALSEISFSGCPVDDVSPLRTLLGLKMLDASGSLVTELDELQYLGALEELNLSNTQVTGLETAAVFQSLQTLDISRTLIRNLDFLKDIPQLQRLNMAGTEPENWNPVSAVKALQSLDVSGTGFTRFAVLDSLTQLQTLNLSGNPVTKLDGLEKLPNLEVLTIVGSPVTSLRPVESIPSLKMIYCDGSGVDEAEVKRFIAERPGVLVVYETEELLKWWENIDPGIKSIILDRLDSIPDPPDTETLHQMIFTETVDLSGYQEISSLKSLEQLVNVHSVNISGTSVSDLGPVGNLTGITELDISGTTVTDLSPLQSLRHLKKLNIENTKITDLSPLDLLPSLEIVFADNSGVTKQEVVRYRKTGKALVVYQTEHLEKWWKGLSGPWRKLFIREFDMEVDPDGKQLQWLVNRDTLEIIDRKNIKDLSPISEFENLKVLNISGSGATDLSPLRLLTTLEGLTVSKGPVSDFSPLTALYNLEKLDLSGTALSNLEFIIELPNLHYLSVQATAIEDLKPLSYLKKLEYLDISYTRVKKLKPLKDMTRLKELICTNTAVSDRNIEKFKNGFPGLKVTYY